MLWETVRLALTAITRNALRSFLTVLGVVIGVAAVIAMVTVGQGSSEQVSANVESLGTSVLVLRPGAQMMGPGARDNAPSFKLADVEALQDLTSLSAVAPTVSSSETAVYGNSNRSTTITGTTSAYLEIGGWEIARGRSFSTAEDRSGANVCIIGETVRTALFGSTDPTGEKIRIKSISCEVIGLLVAKGAGSFGQDQDDLVIMPVRTVQRRLLGSQDVSSISMTVASGVSSERAISDIKTLMRDRRRIAIGEEDDFSVNDMKELASMLNSVNSVLTGLLSSVAAVSLLVGGIGIMNIMLVSVTERTREIGIRLSVGAQASQVLMQFLVEAVVLSLLGGVIGILAGLGLAYVAAQIMAIPFSPSLDVIALAFGFSAVVGMVFGYFPARAAARLDPIEALHYQ
ncbi:MAG: ABC transporter permease [Thioclava marina]|jgi:ABC-type antimicrobial peptide transport system, permease component|uniref:Multidrug ABC transporter substrate-binding protein n=1 Tax=Thioclava marina TaxID=1915077 RepID=A0ABX3MI02_9RHOB|nr:MULTISPECIES: ABC transporter permease [Thioclava]TNE89347.1 MAG: FtsX-like permease family protein [Paracoccaceae bacterium]MBC7145149.1 ABC transporter permease [Thioclava marina]OOY11185.1 multidrug ABC transporter substrate-binding protein [Thioclava marina]OOY26491.1 multidrug ABC transporter substrate-binding protein [Thioclava sp. L04-15]TNF16935.1 MAG: FtsX-like permease family protein [Paracoccaceae bacterium]